ncbi:50S ribosome-binding protein YggL [Peribacillus alkalitolerans]|uniref:50S ribosome-binding protein YggL n=1 Tax=Peribacillus alkalitolerans TaxID=1550385 RepID=UPI0013D6AA8E|nr:50S ribosome-binding protein YggL [Peribacillus alkalitolerans]
MKGFELKRPVGVQIEGYIYANNGDDLKHDEFLDAFIEFIESKGWSFGGGSSQIDVEGKKITDID